MLHESGRWRNYVCLPGDRFVSGEVALRTGGQILAEVQSAGEEWHGTVGLDGKCSQLEK